MKEKIPGIFYLYLHSKLWDLLGGNVIPKKEVKKTLFQWKIPKDLREIIIKEMEVMGLIIKESRYNVSLVRPKFTEKLIKKYCRTLKIF